MRREITKTSMMSTVAATTRKPEPQAATTPRLAVTQMAAAEVRPWMRGLRLDSRKI
jgi:hypothetical protein